MNRVVFQKDRKGALMTTGSRRGSGERRNSFLISYDDGQMGERDEYMKVEEVGGTPVTCWETSNESWWSYVSRIRPRFTQRQATWPCWGKRDGHLANLAIGGFIGGVGRCDLNLERGTLEVMTRHNEMDPRHPSRTPLDSLLTTQRSVWLLVTTNLQQNISSHLLEENFFASRRPVPQLISAEFRKKMDAIVN